MPLTQTISGDTFIATPRRARRYWAMLPAFVGLTIVGVLCFLARDHDRWSRMNGLFESSQWPVFGDLGVVVNGINAHRAGVDPLTLPHAGQVSWYNYPRSWLWLGHTHVQDVPLWLLGTLVGTAWTITAVILCRVQTLGSAILVCAALISPPVLLALERANADLLIFMLCGLVAWTYAQPSKGWLPPLVVALATSLKLYPAALFLLARGERSRRRIVWWAISAAVVAAALILQRNELALVIERTPVLGNASWGSAVIVTRYWHYVADFTDSRVALNSVRAAAILCYLIAGAAAFATGARVGSRDRCAAAPATVCRFTVFALVCTATFALGNSFAYRLIFLVPVMPIWWRLGVADASTARTLRGWALLGLSSGAVSLWAPLWLHGRLFLTVQFANWLVALVLAAGLGYVYAAMVQRGWPATGEKVHAC